MPYKLRLWDGERQYFGSNPPAPQKIPSGGTKFEGITLERGVVHDDGFASWAAGIVAGAGSQTGTGNSPPQKITGQSKFESITLERGVVQDNGFASWLNGASGKGIHLEFYNESGQLVVSYKISRGWVTEHRVWPPAGLVLHNLHRRNGKSIQEQLAGIFQESLHRLS